MTPASPPLPITRTTGRARTHELHYQQQIDAWERAYRLTGEEPQWIPEGVNGFSEWREYREVRSRKAGAA